MKKFIIILQLIVILITSTGCLHSVQLNERALVQAIGIDYGDDEIKLTFQIFSPTTGNGSNIGAASENASIIESSGQTVSEAIQNATLTQGKKIFVGHNRIIILGEEFAKRDLTDALSYFSTNASSRKNVCVCVAEGKASDILNAKINQGILPAETLEKIVRNKHEDGIVENMLLFQFMRSMKNQHESAILPILKMKKDEGDSQDSPQQQGGEKSNTAPKDEEKLLKVSSIAIDGSAIISNGKMVAKLDKSLSRGVLWIRDSVKETSIVVSTDKFDVASLNIYKTKTKVKPSVTDDRLDFVIEIASSATLGETKIRKNVKTQPNDIKAIQVASEKFIQDECEKAFNKVILEEGADVLRFGDIVYKENVAVWKKIKDDWPETAKKINLTVKVNVDIDRIGLEFPQQK